MKVTIKYIPFYERAIFTISICCLAIGFSALRLDLWIVLFLGISSYFVILGNAWIIKLNNHTVKIISLTPLFKSHSIDIKSIISLTSIQTFQQELDVTYETSYSLFKRKYELKYIDQNKIKRAVRFSILNGKVEKALLDYIKKESCLQASDNQSN